MGKGFKYFVHVTVGAEVVFEIDDAEVRVLLAMGGEQNGGQVDHEEGQVDGVGDRHIRDIHKVFETPILLGITEIELNLEAQTVVIGDLGGGQAHIGAK